MVLLIFNDPSLDAYSLPRFGFRRDQKIISRKFYTRNSEHVKALLVLTKLRFLLALPRASGSPETILTNINILLNKVAKNSTNEVNKCRFKSNTLLNKGAFITHRQHKIWVLLNTTHVIPFLIDSWYSSRFEKNSAWCNSSLMNAALLQH
jgi:hypothetical protein